MDFSIEMAVAFLLGRHLLASENHARHPGNVLSRSLATSSPCRRSELKSTFSFPSQVKISFLFLVLALFPSQFCTPWKSSHRNCALGQIAVHLFHPRIALHRHPPFFSGLALRTEYALFGRSIHSAQVNYVPRLLVGN